MSAELYKIMHIAGVVLVIMSLGSLAVFVAVSDEAKGKWRKLCAMFHGLGMTIALIGGFGWIAREKVEFPYPAWVWIKFTLWFVMGGMVAFILKAKQMALVAWLLTAVLTVVGAYVAITKLQ